MARSLRGRLSLLLALGVGLVLLLVGVVLERLVVGWLAQDFDRALEARARALATLTRQDDRGVELDFADELMPEFEARTAPEYFQIDLGSGAGGRILERSRSLVRARARLPRHGLPAAAPRFRDVRLPDGRRGRLVQIDFVPQVVGPGGESTSEVALDPAELPPGFPWATASLRVARGREGLEATTRRFRAVLAAGVLMALATALLLIRGSLRVGLRDLETIRRRVEGLDASRLDARVALSDPPAEIAPVAEQLDALLARLEAAFERERRLSSDLAHELRTPIAELRTLAEVGAAEVGPGPAAELLGEALAIALHMERTVAHLLTLARHEGAQEPPERTEVDVGGLVAGAWRHLEAEAAGRAIVLDRRVPDGIAWVTDRGLLGLIVSNLLANAVAHAPAGSTVVCEARGGPDPGLDVVNPAGEIGPDDLPHLFERLWRKDPSRSGGRHSGLGLALVETAARRLGMEARARLEDGADGPRLRVGVSARRPPPRSQNR